MTAEEFTARQASLGLTNRQLSEKLNCDEGSVSKWKRGQTSIPDYIAGYLDLLVYVYQNAIKVTFSLGELMALGERAQRLGVTVNDYLVYLVRNDITEKPPSSVVYYSKLKTADPGLKVAESHTPYKTTLNAPAEEP